MDLIQKQLLQNRLELLMNADAIQAGEVYEFSTAVLAVKCASMVTSPLCIYAAYSYEATWPSCLATKAFGRTLCTLFCKTRGSA